MSHPDNSLLTLSLSPEQQLRTYHGSIGTLVGRLPAHITRPGPDCNTFAEYLSWIPADSPERFVALWCSLSDALRREIIDSLETYPRRLRKTLAAACAVPALDDLQKVQRFFLRLYHSLCRCPSRGSLLYVVIEGLTVRVRDTHFEYPENVSLRLLAGHFDAFVMHTSNYTGRFAITRAMIRVYNQELRDKGLWEQMPEGLFSRVHEALMQAPQAPLPLVSTPRRDAPGALALAWYGEET